ncbi:FMRFamide receptor-like [Bactrocera neohumeralis]|uniref:FMRFamide receptor n=1 Tax=Bactrocera tryoni TaxID=59916 RepID=UPI001A956EF4|nr:FMRFamide receptor [Bactrocera tryoni]XP_050336115.1 FMRFamide receptor-like [Bactrocera neohumeralis]XP_050336116.1 FMRFamide receptor-like [Bactrocera neohumeralis]XP_050336117.1 FMRFamide receptor-like [Bactrocera neohumeralis]
MTELNATHGFDPHIFHALKSSPRIQDLLRQEPALLPPADVVVDSSTHDYDAAPINLQDFIQSVSDSNVFVEYIAPTDSTIYSLGKSATDDGTLFPQLTENFTFHNFYSNQSNETQCKDVYHPDDDTRLEFWVCGVVLNIVGIFGIIGNIISMIILSRPQMRSSINYLLIGLARCDTTLIITSMLLFGIPCVYPYSGYFFYYYNYIYPFISPSIFPIGLTAQTASIYMTFTVTLERYVAVCHPLKSRALCTYGRAKIYFIVCCTLSLLYNLPRFWEVMTVSYQPEGSEIVYHCLRPSPLRKNQTYINIYIHWCYLIINYIIPFLTLAILNCLIYRKVKRANRERQRLSRSEKREIGLATMLIFIVIVFFLLNFLALVVNIDEAFYNKIDHSLTKISNLLVTINSSANFLIYVIFGEKFKRIFLLIFFKRRLSRDQPDLIHYESSISNNGDGTINHRSSGRFSRHGTQRSTTGTYLVTGGGSNNSTLKNVRLVQTGSPGVVKIKRNRAPSPGPVVYYPARDSQRTTVVTPVALASNNNTALSCDWIDAKNGQMTSGI